MKTLDEALGRLMFSAPRLDEETLHEMDAKFAEFRSQNESLSNEIQENVLVQQMIAMMGRKLTVQLNAIRTLPPSADRGVVAGQCILKALMGAFVHGALIGLQMEKQELPQESPPL